MASDQVQADDEIDVAANLAAVKARIEAVRARSPGAAGRVELVAVGKTQPQERILAALEAGHRVFGENYVQEASARWPAWRLEYPGLELHLIGALQTNKVKEALRIFDVIQTLDRPKLAREIAKELAKGSVACRLLIEVNIGEEPQKGGVMPGELEGFLRLCRDELGLPVVGMMAIPPADEDVAPYAALLAKLAARHGLAEVSVGMSADFEAAIPFGATIVRVGTAIFGARRPKLVG